ncbi:hypothetical protein [Dapis sp. BLCC M229]|uniref:hypothetical protein n=1 Tax=Dapis sp. BLCC M229 TaxID=3400188 RepID=UPI003CF1E3FA
MNIKKHILTSLQATIIGATFSLLQYPATAANFTTTFTLPDDTKPLTATWSGEDMNADGLIRAEELMGMTFDLVNFGIFEVTPTSFSYNLSTNTIAMSASGTVSSYGFGFYNVTISPSQSKIQQNGPRVPNWNYIRHWRGTNAVETIALDALEADSPESLTPQPTPEPSLTLGFITLSGLMLGGTRKIRKAKAQKV